ncbi:hypothetical protein BJ165DRAFT_1615510 [Panaeolus papilionaceus]|nr:hypothetical protein BJ165DRAFT_1615510 [Panaeolus papilionaceus]
MTTVAAATEEFLYKIEKRELKLTAEDSKKVNAAVNEHLKKPSTREEIRAEVEDLANTIVTIEQDFAEIRGEVQRIDGLGVLRDKDTNEVNLYAPKWIKMHEEYTSLMTISQTTANKAYSEIQTLLTVIMPIAEGNYDITKKGNAIKNYITKLEKFDVEAQDNAKRFLRLQQDVEIFRVTLKASVKNQLEEVTQRLERIDKDIKALQEQLDKTSGFFAGAWEVLQLAGPEMAKGAGKAISIGTTAGGIAATAGLAALAPAVGVGILVAGFAAIGWSIFKGYETRAAQRKEKEDKIESLKQEKEDLTRTQEELKETLKRLYSLDKTFDRLIDRLGALQGIWRMLITDAQRLKIKLVDLDETEDDLIAELTAVNVKAAYEALKEALDAYSLATRKTKED